MKRMLLGLGMAALSAVGVLDLGGSEARAQLPGESVVYETVAPGQRTVTYGERYRVRQGPFKTVIRERPYRYVTTTPPVVRETRVFRPAPVVQQQVFQPAPVVESRVVQPPPIVESRVVQPPPIVETRTVQPAPVIQNRVIQPNPVVQTRYYGPYPY